MTDKWQPIETFPGTTDLVLIAREGIAGNWEYVHCAFMDSFTYANWFLPFDSDRDENGTPLLNEDEQPTHWMPLPPAPEKINNN